MVKRKTRRQIIDETVEAYRDPSKRAFDSSIAACRYLLDDGRMCAVGRCMTLPTTTMRGTSDNLWKCNRGDQYTQQDPLQLEPELRAEYRGHHALFWRDLQLLHDIENNWDVNGLTPVGEQVVKDLHERWDEPTLLQRIRKFFAASLTGGPVTRNIQQ